MATFLFVLVLMGLVMLLMSVTILLKKNGNFPSTHIEDNQHLKKMGISCASHDEYECGCSTPVAKSGCELCVAPTCTFSKE